MALLKKNRAAQWPLYQEFTFTMADTMVDTAGATNALNVVGSKTYDVAGLPPGAVVIGGELVVGVVSNDATTATVAVGDSTSATRYLGATTIKTAARTPLVPTGYNSLGEDLRITIANGTGGATTGTVTVRVGYVIAGRCNEVQPT